MTAKSTDLGSRPSASQRRVGRRSAIVVLRGLAVLTVATAGLLAVPSPVGAGFGPKGAHRSPAPATVAPATTTITTVASPTVVIGGQINDTATVSGRVNPIDGATVTFNLFGAGDAACASAPIFTSTVPINPDGTATSGSFTPAAAGNYAWNASYSGDANNRPAGGGCGEYYGETVIVTQATPTVTTVASPTVEIGGQINDTAAVSGRVNPIDGATVTFNLFGAGDTTCTSAPIFSSTVPINPDGTAISASFSPAAAGTYEWIASYNGDANNRSATGTCGNANETVTVTPFASLPPVSPVEPTPVVPATPIVQAVLATPAITTVASPGVELNGTVTDTATVSGRVNPVDGATVTFRLYGTGDATCTAAPVFTSTVALNPNGTATSASFAPAAVGTYRWIATYSGDANNSAVSGICGDAGETVAVSGIPIASPLLPSTGTTLSGPLTIGGLLLGSGMLMRTSSRRRRSPVSQ